MDVTVTVGYNPELVDTICRQARTTAIAAHRALHQADADKT